eukprot:TRINITY_DN18965_c0_g3_i1.p2 TRINITY_DN18965_c0_g3~~TRINITY_DN18965_c0_g3_i1.p2  ORF type:complete len:156 (+),score=35.92 TRINITY_DN18965_c0_g3_i1:75-542(+)
MAPRASAARGSRASFPVPEPPRDCDFEDDGGGANALLCPSGDDEEEEVATIRTLRVPTNLLMSFREDTSRSQASSLDAKYWFDRLPRGPLVAPEDPELFQAPQLRTAAPAPQLLGGDAFMANSLAVSFSLGRTLGQQRRSASAADAYLTGCVFHM